MDDDAFMQEYERLAHAIQSAIAYELGLGLDAGATPKHLRVGVDLQRADQGSVVRLLVKKGLITDDEVKEAILEGLHAEVERAEQQHGTRFR